MNRPDARTALRRSNPFFMVAVGVLLGAMLVALTSQPSSQPAVHGSASPGGVSPVGSSGQVVGSGRQGSVPGRPGGGKQTAGAPTGSATVGPGGSRTGNRGQSTSSAPRPGGSGHVAGGCAARPLDGVQGVSANAIKIGFALPNLGVLSAAVNIGNPQQDVEAVLAGMRRAKLLPICGRTITPVFRTFNVLDPSQSRAACDGFADQDKVFAVVSLFAFAAAECVTQEKHLPLLDSGNALTEPQFARSPLLFSDDPPVESQLRDAAYWAVRSGMLNGKSIGVYYNENGPGGADPPGTAVKHDVVDVLAQLGHPVKDVVVSSTSLSATNPLASDPTDSEAVQRFKADHIQVVFPLEFSSNFFQQTQLQGYHAQWMVYGTAMVNDATTGTYPSSFNGARGLSFDHVGEVKSGIPESPQTRACLGYDTQAGHSAPAPESAAGQTLRESCDPVSSLVRALAAAGRGLDDQTLIAGMESIRGLDESYYSVQSFGPAKHWGATRNVAEQWSSGCSCWKLASRWQPLYWQP